MSDERKDEFLDRLWKAWTAFIERGKGKGTSQTKLAEKIRNLSGERTRQDDISRWLRGVGRPSYEELPALAEALGVRRYWLAFNEEPMVEPSRKRIQVAHDRPTNEEDGDAKRRGA